ncbi:hypothetical protein MSG28_010684 [Choristoneura fumiferana]|uniref:Uncharacterized protein n=1 Tax=Choristoneura fumiferana TaxID=7141 RepID=A0ACC0KPF1_CHOFU|nr:hypothetical protein MSG28_010684 [Choristoneura fumiferana]
MDSDSEIVEAETDGSICSIQMRNFFCHENLQIDFNKNVNYIVGRNGSGKSAILTALVVGLGGRAAATNRGNNLNSFIKKGANSASIEIKIKNNSSQAYKHDEYGDYITVVRHINSSGGSSYKVKNARGEVVSTKFDTVKNIIRAHDIQVDNPISVLNQDDARSFHASDAKKKYMLFRKATNMDATETNYNKALETGKLAFKISERKNEALQSVEKEYKELKAIHDRLLSRGEIEARKKALENEYYWSEVLQYERQADSIQVQFDKQKARLDKLAEKLNKMKEHYGNNNGAIDALRSQLEESTLQRTALEQEVRELDDQLRPAQTTLRSLKAATAKHNDVLAREKRKIAEIQGEIDRIDSGDAATQRVALEAAAAAATEAADAVRARYSTAQHHAAQAQQHAAHAAGRLERANAAPARARHALGEGRGGEGAARAVQHRAASRRAGAAARRARRRATGARKRRAGARPPRSR